MKKGKEGKAKWNMQRQTNDKIGRIGEEGTKREKKKRRENK